MTSFGPNDGLSYLEYLVRYKMSSNMLANHVSVVRANFVFRGLNFSIWAHPNIKYFQKSVRTNRHLAVTLKKWN